MGPGTITGTKGFSCLVAGMAAVLAAATPAGAQQNRIPAGIDASQAVSLTNHVHPKAQRQYDRGPVDAGFVMDRLSVLLAPSAEQQAKLDAYLSALQDPGSPDYRNWLTPEQFADRFGVSTSDLGQITGWLGAQGFTIRTVAPSRNWVAFSGTASQVRQTFRTETHRFQVNGELHFSNTADPSVPAALHGVITAIRGLNDFAFRPPQPHLTPAYTAASGNHYLAPADLATIYNLNSLAANGYDGTGQKLAIVGQSAVDLNDLRNFRTLFGLPASDPQIVLVPGGADPGIVSGDLVEADLDLEWAGAAAKNASLVYVYSRDVMDALQYTVTQNLAPVIAMSYGDCETAGGASQRSIAQQANAQGITWIAASGDSGAAGCESTDATVATHGLAVNLPSSIPEVTGVGGTTFAEGSGTYWGTNNASLGSALSYVPETSWNDSGSRRLEASGGGASAIFGKPGWQAGPGVPADNARDVPDVALAASPQHDGAILCTGGSCANGLGTRFTVVGGTSLSTPVFAGIATLVNHYLVGTGAVAKAGLGNMNPTLYGLAQTTTDIFHDVTTGNNVVPCRIGTADCTMGMLGYQAGPGYDLVTGLGSVNANNLVTEWKNFQPAPAALSSVTVTPATVAGGASATLTVTLTAAAPSSGISVTLTSTSTAFPVPPNVTVPAGQFSISVQVQTPAVPASIPATVTATYNSVSKTANVTVAPVVLPTVTSLEVSPSTVAGGASAFVIVTLSGPAPVGGAAVALGSNSTVFPVPATLTVPAGHSIASVSVQTTSVTVSTPVTVTATYNSTSMMATVTVAPIVLPTLTGVTVDPSTIAGGAFAILTVTLSGPAPAGDVAVTLGSNSAVFPVPAILTVRQGRSTASVVVQTTAVTVSTPVTVTATYNSVSKTANVTVAPVVLPTLTAVTVDPTSIAGGAFAMVTVTLSGPAPSGGAAVTLASSATAFPVPASLTVREGRSSASVVVQTTTVTASTPVTVTATYNSVSKAANVTVAPAVLPTLFSLAVFPANVPGGATASLTVTLTGQAPPGGAVVTLSSNATAFPVPATVTVPAGRSSATVLVQTKAVTTATPVTVTATYNATSKTATATVTPVVLPTLGSIRVTPAAVTGGRSTTLTVRLTGPAPPGGASITLSSSNTAALQLHSPVVIREGHTSGRVRISTAGVTAATTVTITASYNTSTQTTTLTVDPGSTKGGPGDEDHDR